jgi:hypothetical protein
VVDVKDIFLKKILFESRGRLNQSWIQAVQCLIGTTTYRRIDYITSFLRMISYIMKGNGKKKKFCPETFMTHYLVNIYQFRVDWAFWSIISSRKKRSPGAPELGLIVKVLMGRFLKGRFLVAGLYGLPCTQTPRKR